MNKDYFQDITPPAEERESVHVAETLSETLVEDAQSVPEKSIRNVNVSRRSTHDRREVPPVGAGIPIRRVGINTYWLAAAALALVLIVGVFSLFLFKKTTVTITPRSHTIVFDATTPLTAYPASSSATGTLTYTVQSFDIEDSATAASQGTSHAEHKASGSVTVVNEFSTSPVTLVKNTRFETPDGLIFRSPADIKVPGMNGKTPGTISVTLIADQSGSKYNVGPVSKLTLPGLKGGVMYAKVTARAQNAFTGGFSGNEPSVPKLALDAAISEIRGRLQETTQKKIATFSDTGIVYATLVRTTYAPEVLTPEPNNQVRITIKAHIDVPVISKQGFLQTVASKIITDAQGSDMQLIPGTGYGAQLTDSTNAPSLSDPIQFTVTGTANLIWNVDSPALTRALVGKSKSSFESIVNAFPSIAEAHATVEPFWSNSFPNNTDKINIVLLPAKSNN